MDDFFPLGKICGNRFSACDERRYYAGVLLNMSFKIRRNVFSIENSSNIRCFESFSF